MSDVELWRGYKRGLKSVKHKHLSHNLTLVLTVYPEIDHFADGLVDAVVGLAQILALVGLRGLADVQGTVDEDAIVSKNRPLVAQLKYGVTLRRPHSF